MAKVLLVDTNFSSIPIYQSLIEGGHEVYVAGKNPNDALAKISKNYAEIDYSNTDEIKHFIKSKNIEKIIPGCTDKSYESCAKIGEGTSLWHGDSFELYNLINNKEYFRNFTKSLAIPSPKKFDSIEEAILEKKEIIIKPSDSFSGLGITRIKNKTKELINTAISAAKSASLSKKFLIEEFVHGQLYSYSAFIKNQKVIKSFTVREDCVNNPYTVDSSYLIESNKISQELCDCIEKIAKKIKLSDGLIHSQFIHNGIEFWIIEITRRCPGDLYSKLIQMSSGFSYANAYAQNFLGKEFTLPQKNIYKNIIRHTISGKKTGHFLGIDFQESLPKNIYIPLKTVGENIEDLKKNRIGIIFLMLETDFQKKYFYEKIIKNKLYLAIT